MTIHFRKKKGFLVLATGQVTLNRALNLATFGLTVPLIKRELEKAGLEVYDPEK